MLGFFELFKKLEEDFGVISNFIETHLEGMLGTFRFIGHGYNVAWDLVASLPEWLKVFGIATIVISLGFTILGRSTGGYKND